METEVERSVIAEETRTICICDGPILVDETVFGLGIRCILCGLSANATLSEKEKQQRARTLRSVTNGTA